MAIKYKTYRVKRDSLGVFKPGDLVVALENNVTPWCVSLTEYSKDDKELCDKLDTEGLIDIVIPDNWSPLDDEELEEVLG